ncbi:tRNA (adenosine(37)-N6)-threonylcarbamoyltransferase complex ATPase subunit type 1 TsaE [Segatella bryantii]|uniref:tRNA (adenosine(37)-N6)-threonylcarbamoyltransferase complex ATPase subunit type 1 TsaE n=1 Tax=Segatella bryantii TaxID=77095 RepID=UPI00241E90E8|nr:tRNA (adenosine(37)-N6)-threonylcarbamoyltransferase complex ATPase subunit type 1 TsaE [Segatella bryantii]
MMDNTFKITTHSEEETIEVAQNLESEKFPNMVICLNGDLGSGKTVFTKGFASAMAIEEITSPTFNIIKEYVGELPLYHMDVYRTNGRVDELGLDEYFNKGGVTIIEWAEMIEDCLPKERLDITFKITGENTRVMVITPHGDKYLSVCEDAL